MNHEEYKALEKSVKDQWGTFTQGFWEDEMDALFQSAEELLESLNNPPEQANLLWRLREELATDRVQNLANSLLSGECKFPALFDQEDLLDSHSNNEANQLKVLFLNTGIPEVNSNVQNWLAGKGISEDWAFKLCFALDMDAESAKKFLEKACAIYAFNYRKVKHIFYSYGLTMKKTYYEIDSMINKYYREVLTEKEKAALKGKEGIFLYYSSLGRLKELLSSVDTISKAGATGAKKETEGYKL